MSDNQSLNWDDWSRMARLNPWKKTLLLIKEFEIIDHFIDPQLNDKAKVKLPSEI